MVPALWGPLCAPLSVPSKGTALGSNIPGAGTCWGRGSVGVPTCPSWQAHLGLPYLPLAHVPDACPPPAQHPPPARPSCTLLPVPAVRVLISAPASFSEPGHPSGLLWMCARPKPKPWSLPRSVPKTDREIRRSANQ